MKTYRFLAQPQRTYFPAPAGYLRLSEDLLVSELAGVVVRELSQDERGRVTIEVELPRDSDEQALEEVATLLAHLGFVVLRATVSEWVNEIIERALLGAFAGGTLGAAAKNTLAAGVALVLGAIILGASGAAVRKLKAEYEASRDPFGAWSLREISRPHDEGFELNAA